MAGSQDMMIIVVMMMMMSSVFSVLAGGALFFTLPQEGDECEGKDTNGNYVIDEDLKCVLDACDSGYSISSSGKKCIVDEIYTDDDDDDDGGSGGSGGSGGGECVEDLSVVSHEATLGPCDTVYDVDPKEVKYQGTYFLPRNPTRGKEWIHELEVNGDTRSFLASHQSPDDYCKMVKFDISKESGTCKYKVVDAGYTTSPTAASTCKTKEEVIAHWAAKNQQTVAPNDFTGGYGLQYMKYDKFCAPK